MFDKDNKFGFIINNNNSNDNVEGLDKVKTDINNIKSEVDELNTQYKDIANKGTTVEVIERVAKEELTKQINAGTLKLGDISTDDVKIYSSQEETYEFVPIDTNHMFDVAQYFYCNEYTFDKDIVLKTLIVTVNSPTTGEKSLNFMIVDKDMNVIDNSVFKFNIEQTGIQSVTIPLGGKKLPAGSYICLQSVGDCKVRYGSHKTCVIRSVDVNQSTATFKQNLKTSCIMYKIVYMVADNSINLTNKLNDYVLKNDLPNEVQTILVKTTNRLYGKKIIAIGDSMVQGHTISKDKGWLAKIADRNNMTYVNYGINGTFMTNKLYNNTYKGVVERYVDMDKDADYVIVFAGTNDAGTNVTIGENNSTNPAEFKGALNIICKGLLTTYPTAKIMFITPYLRNEKYRQYVQAIHDICEDKYSIRVYDNIKYGGICWSNQAQVEALTLKDTYHLNLTGMEYASYKYEEELKRL